MAVKVKKVVKVMNFHSLLRVDKARKKAEKYFTAEKQLNDMINNVLWNKNLILDRKVLKPNNKMPELNIYIGSDYGFCGSFNSLIMNELKKDKKSQKILIGKKIMYTNDNVLLHINKEVFMESLKQIEDIIYTGMRTLSYSKINVIYNHYNSFTDFEFIKKALFPVSISKDKTKNKEYNEDFVVEADINKMISDLISLYICYEIRIAETNSLAAENVVRQQVTNESLKKIDEIEAEEIIENRKMKKNKSFKKIIEIFSRI